MTELTNGQENGFSMTELTNGQENGFSMTYLSMARRMDSQ
jgi:hypothetical protein